MYILHVATKFTNNAIRSIHNELDKGKFHKISERLYIENVSQNIIKLCNINFSTINLIATLRYEEYWAPVGSNFHPKYVFFVNKV